ncbi:MAG: hypothetical protein CVV44_13825 [Spirochaetae bacterium HGW-Spirochaetae-1]|jgi:sigma-B regulation protein RsbU (phosphoserine phosphatase)|nr:MAG: hypothetical protein CVV44_13825 [Spirochaetae bacterium HGW-Spirochaetae-1]
MNDISPQIKDITDSFVSSGRRLSIGHVEIITRQEEAYQSIYSATCIENFNPITVDELRKNPDFPTDNSGENRELKGKNSKNQDIHILMIPVTSDDNSSVICVFQSTAPFDKEKLPFLQFFAAMIDITGKYSIKDASTIRGSDRYKKDLINMRDMQAKLFPKFNVVRGFQIGSAFLPAELMSGNFIDGFYLDENIYQVVVCDVSGYDAASTFAGAAIRTLIRSEASKKMTPSVLIETITMKLKNIIAVVHALIYISVFQFNIKTGKTMISSYGPLMTLFYNKKKNGYANLGTTEVGRLLAKRIFYKDLSLMMEPGDILLYYSNGMINASNETGKEQYGESNLYASFMKQKESSSTDLVHTLIESLNDYTNYSPLEADVILIAIKREAQA